MSPITPMSVTNKRWNRNKLQSWLLTWRCWHFQTNELELKELKACVCDFRKTVIKTGWRTFVKLFLCLKNNKNLMKHKKIKIRTLHTCVVMMLTFWCHRELEVCPWGCEGTADHVQHHMRSLYASPNSVESCRPVCVNMCACACLHVCVCAYACLYVHVYVRVWRK